MQSHLDHFPVNHEDNFDIVIIGGGLTGQAAALALSDYPYEIALVCGPAPAADGRTVALMPEALDLLDELGLKPLLDQHGSALTRLRLIDDSGSLFRPPSVLFHARELNLDAYRKYQAGQRVTRKMHNPI
jgi:2-octaprenyl-6-methoxyphenol hydroxylase